MEERTTTAAGPAGAPGAAPGPAPAPASEDGPGPDPHPDPHPAPCPAPRCASEPVPVSRADRAAVRDALGVGVAVGLSGFAFGVTAAGAGLSLAQTCALSLLVFTGASQFALVGALAAGGGAAAAAAGALFLGLRNAFYGLRLSEVLRLPGRYRPLAAQWVIDETSAVALAQPDRRSARLGFFVTGATLYVLWNLTTLLGSLGAGALGDPADWGLDAAGPAVFLALLAPMLDSVRARVVAALAVVLALATLPLLPAGVPVLVAALAAPLALVGRRRRPRAGAEGER
ncbi:AzlC family ABC transporter permease [Streptomyces sp. 549]|uniref:AzlC family ABC transporter permease n=1 Tax=Streptomyces sp. 549 TaxID=3049076 RepID=UPI0024C3A41E|nr:AzlC family ABC transporter permease [Streptomyces sp. 549]MDK1476424.1 AzlC family ABC transporter permease [Streptomyces sp. 549]